MRRPDGRRTNDGGLRFPNFCTRFSTNGWSSNATLLITRLFRIGIPGACFSGTRPRRRLNQSLDFVLSDLTAAEVLAFLKHREEDRKVSIGTRNCRLAALHSFFGFLLGQEPLAAGQCAEVLRIPVKRATSVSLSYLEPTRLPLSCLSPTAPQSRASATMPCSPCYTTPARGFKKHWTCARARSDWTPLRMSGSSGKGRKERTCPLWPETVDLLKALLKRQPRPDDQPIFVNRYGQPARSRQGFGSN